MSTTESSSSSNLDPESSSLDSSKIDQRDHRHRHRRPHSKQKNDSPSVKLSKSLSWILRHGAKEEGIKISQDGFVAVNDLLAHPKWKKYKFEDIRNIVETNDKQRFFLKQRTSQESGEEQWYICATQGHSMKSLEIEMEEIQDPKELPVVVHGTYLSKWKSILKEGLSIMGRKHIHFATGLPSGANKVISGMRNSCDLYIYIDTELAMQDGIVFLRSKNGVILTDGKDGKLAPKYFKQVVTAKGDKINI